MLMLMLVWVLDVGVCVFSAFVCCVLCCCWLFFGGGGATMSVNEVTEIEVPEILSAVETFSRGARPAETWR